MLSPTRNGTLTRAGAAALAVNVLVLVGCASTKVDAQWIDPQFAGRSLRGANVLILCDAAEPVVRRICQDQMAARLRAIGATPVIGPDLINPTPGRPPAVDQYLSAARAARAKAVLTTSITPEATVVGGGPLIGFGIGGFGGGGHRGTFGGIGVDLPIGGAHVSTGYAANSMLTDVASGRLMWTGKATTPSSADVNTQVGELANAMVAAAQRAGLF